MATPPDFTAGQILTAAQMNQVGFWKVASGTIASLGTTPTQITNVFDDANYSNYRLFLRGASPTTSLSFSFKFLNNTTPASTAYYAYGSGYSAFSGSLAFSARSNNASALLLSYATSAVHRVVTFDIINPNKAEPSFFSGYFSETTTADAMTWGGNHLTATAYNGFELFTNTGTMNVTYDLYGYN
jgi:hypothetical protein